MTTSEHRLRGGRLADGAPPFGYGAGFRNHHSTEAEAGALPIGRNSPQRAPLGLYAEQLSGTAFTAPRGANLRSWLYRILPSVRHGSGFEPVDSGWLRTAPCRETDLPAQQLRWKPIDIPQGESVDFVDGLRTIASCGDAALQVGMASHVYVANRSMAQKTLANGDGEMLLVPQQGAIRCVTEFGVLDAAPGEIAVIPRGVKFRVELLDPAARGFVCESYGAAFALPERGPVGANGFANERDFLYPAAAYEDIEAPHRHYFKSGGRLYLTELAHSPLDVVAWHGNYAPYKYDLRRFNTMGSISYDHPDPSIFTVLTSPSDTPGTANVDFVIFPERWLVMEDSFRPPWYHRNVMSEFMALIYGVYDARPGGFGPGGMSLHNAMLPHGPDSEAFERASSKPLQPEKLSDTLAIMFESRYVLQPTAYAAQPERIDRAYPQCWSALQRRFERP